MRTPTGASAFIPERSFPALEDREGRRSGVVCVSHGRGISSVFVDW